MFGNTDVLTTEPAAAVENSEFEKIGESSKWDHHITLAVIATIVSSLCLNPFAVAFGIGAIYFSITVRA